MGSYSFIVIHGDNKIMNSCLARLSHFKKFSGLSRNFASSSPSNPIFELRTYNLVPKDVGKFLALSKEKFHLRTQHSVLLGYWTTELGGLNQVVHLWQYESYSHRAEIRARLGGDQEWQQEYFQRILPWLQHQDNLTLESLSEPLQAREEGGTYELMQFQMKAGQNNWRDDLLSLAAGLQTDQAQVLGAFSSVFGPHNTAVLVWRHKHIDTAAQLSAQLHTSPAGQAFLSGVMSVDSKLMSPQPFSPWK